MVGDSVGILVGDCVGILVGNLVGKGLETGHGGVYTVPQGQGRVKSVPHDPHGGVSTVPQSQRGVKGVPHDPHGGVYMVPQVCPETEPVVMVNINK